MNTVPRVLSVAGTDPTGGAGIQADLKAIAALGGYGMAVVTALVAQNTMGIRAVHAPPVEFLRHQLDGVCDDVEVDAVKLGMLFDTAIVETVADWLGRVRPPALVVDPVMVATSGDRLLLPEAEAALMRLLGEVESDVLVTPNLPELAVLASAAPARTESDLRDQARVVASAYGVRVLAKGGHLDADHSDDVLVAPDGTTTDIPGRRVATRHTHGTGCSLSAAVATARVRHGSWEPAVREAKAWLTESLQAAGTLHVGRGRGPISHFAGLWSRAGTYAPPPVTGRPID